jgi:hypothetical protein
MQPRQQFRTIQEWQDFIGRSGGKVNGLDLFTLRRNCYTDIEKVRQRPLIIYASRFLDGNIPNIPNFIELSDVDGFTDLVNAVKTQTKSDKIDVLIHSPGGQPDATERIVYILRNNFSEVNFLIPHSAYSAATMMALSGNEIVMHPSATLGPIDPQINNTPARSIKRGFEKVRELLKIEGPEALPAYIPLIEKYSLELLELCQDSEALSQKLVSDWLTQYMFGGDAGKKDIIQKAVVFFSDYDEHLLHARPLTYNKIKDFGLNIKLADDNLRPLLWEAYILLNGFFELSGFYKLFETAHGVSWGRQLIIQQQPQQPPQQKK